MKVTGVKYIGPIFDNSGYAQACRGNILSLLKVGIPVTLYPVSFEQSLPDLGRHKDTLYSLVNNDIEYNVVIIHTTPEFWEKHTEPDRVNVGYTIWETSKLHPDWPDYINKNVQKVLVGSKWNVGVFQECGVKVPIGVIPHAMDMEELENVRSYKVGDLSMDTYKFYSVFQWTERKNPMALIKAYWSAFQNNEDVALIVKAYRMGYTDKEKDAIRETITRAKQMMPLDDYPKIVFIPDLLDHEQILGLHKFGNCYVTFDRGEGFGLSPFLAGAMGNPVIATGFGGITEYADKNNSYLMDYTYTPVWGMAWSPWYRGDQMWAEPDVYQGINYMKEVYENQGTALRKGLQMKRDIEDNFSWTAVGDRIVKELQEI